MSDNLECYYEGIAPEPGEQPLYRRELAVVYNDNGDTTDAWIYWYNKDVTEINSSAEKIMSL